MNKLYDSWRSYLTETKLRVFDFDDTLVKSDSKIKVTDPSGKQSVLTPGEYSTHEKDPRNDYDFSEFDDLVNPREVKKVTNILRNVVGAGTDGRQNVVLTARDPVAETPIQDYLEEIGIDISKIDFVLLGDSAPMAKSRWIEDKIRTGATDVLFLDDSGKNVEAVLGLKEKYPDVKIDARRVGYAEEIEEQMVNERLSDWDVERGLDTTGYNNPTAHERTPTWKKIKRLLDQERSQESKYQSALKHFEGDPEHPHFEKHGPPVPPEPDPELEEFKDNHNMFVDFMWNLDDPSNTFFKKFKTYTTQQGWKRSPPVSETQNRIMHAKFKWLFPYDAAPGLGCKNKILYLDALVASFYDNPSMYEVQLDEKVETKLDSEVSRVKTVYEKCKVELQSRKTARHATAQEMGAEEYRVDALEEQLLENAERLIKEVTVDEIGHIADILNGMDPKDLAFNRLFDEKLRLAIDFPTLDTSTELGQFIDLWRIMGYTVDWDKGTVSGDRRLRDVSPAGFANQILDMGSGKGGPQTKKINMKIGKWLAKLLGYQTKYQALRQKVEDYYSKEGPRPQGGFTGNQIAKALSEQELKNYYRLESYIYMMARSDIAAYPPQLESVQSIQKLIKYWRDNAAFIKKEASKAKEGSNQYSIIITRHPIDVLRMSDFENIQSCHSPPSRGGGSAEYKCAVAEAHGHGAVAYVVKTEDLLHATNTGNIESAEQEIQDGEIFFDDERSVVGKGTILPVARIRLRQVKYYEHTKDPETYAGRNPYEGIELAIPEIRTYPAVSAGGVPGFAKRILDWAKENQKEQIEGAPIYMTTRGGTKQIDLDQFIKFGGSYQDNLVNSLIKNLWPQDENFGFNGTIVQDTNTENRLDASLLSVALVDQYQEAVNDFTETYNNRMRYCEVEGSAFDDGDGGVAIEIDATMMLKWSKSEWKSLPNKNQAEHVEYELNDIGYSWAELSDIGAQNHNIVVTFKILPQKLVGFGGQEYAWGPESFEEFAQLVDTYCDDKAAGVKQVCEVFFKREGWMEGGAIVELGQEVLNGEYSSSEWDAEAEEGYEYGEMESVRFTTDVTISYADINNALVGPGTVFKGVNEETAPAIAESRQFRIALRKAMTTPAQEAVNKSYYPPIETETLSVSPTEIFIRIEYYASMDDPDGLVEVLKALVEHWDDWHNEVHDVVKKTFIWAARQAKVASQAAPGELGLEEQKIFEVEELLRFR